MPGCCYQLNLTLLVGYYGIFDPAFRALGPDEASTAATASPIRVVATNAEKNQFRSRIASQLPYAAAASSSKAWLTLATNFCPRHRGISVSAWRFVCMVGGRCTRQAVLRCA